MEQCLGLKQCKSVRALKWQFVGGLPCWSQHVRRLSQLCWCHQTGRRQTIGLWPNQTWASPGCCFGGHFSFHTGGGKGRKKERGWRQPGGWGPKKKRPNTSSLSSPAANISLVSSLSLSVPCLALSLIFFAGPLNHDHHDKGGSGKLTETRNLFHCVGDEILPETIPGWNTS